MNKLSLNYTGIGSLPFEGCDATVYSIDFIFKYFKSIPYPVELIKFSDKENMILRFSENMPGFFEKNGEFFIKNDENFIKNLKKLKSDFEKVVNSTNLEDSENILEKYKMSSFYFGSFEPFLKELKNKEFDYVKSSITGPLTFYNSIQGLSDKAKEGILKTLILKALWQILKIKKYTKNILFFVDEPVNLSYFKDCAITTLNKIFDTLNDFGVTTGIHCCSKPDFEILFNLNSKIINFDCYSYFEDIIPYKDKLNLFLKNGGYLAFGIVPTYDILALEELDLEKLKKIYYGFVDILCYNKIPRELILRQTIITPSCGLGSLSTACAVKVSNLTKQLSEALKKENNL